MTEARTAVLSQIRAALGPERPVVVVPREYRVAGDRPPGSPAALDLLADRLADYGAQVRRVPAAQVPPTIARVIEQVIEQVHTQVTAASSSATANEDPRDSASVVVPDGIDPAWLTATDATVLRDAREAPLSHRELDRATAVVTAARVAIADTGTIVLDGERDQGRRAITLLPDVHICVVRADQVVRAVPEAVRLLARHAERPQTWISGPSATSDIELDRVEGVHGPRTLHVLIIE